MQDCNFDCNDAGIGLQAMDNSHVALVSMLLKSEVFQPYRCDRNVALGINLGSLTKVLRAAQADDILTLKAEDAPDVVNLVFESADADRLSEYDIKLMDIDQEHLGIPETDYAAKIKMPSSEFTRICRDLLAVSESGTSRAMGGHIFVVAAVVLTRDGSVDRGHQGGRALRLPGRYWQRRRHSTESRQCREAGPGSQHRLDGARESNVLAQIPCQFLQGHGLVEFGQDRNG